MLPKRLPRMSIGGAAGIAALTSLIFSLFVARATHPPGYFMKYIDAATAGRLEPTRLLDFSPLYLFLARLLLPLGGEELLLVFQCLFHAATSAFIAISVGTLTGPTWALAAGIFSATYRPFLVYAGVFEPESLILLCLAAAITFGILARRAFESFERSEDRPRAPWVWAAASGVCLGLAAISRPQYVLLTAVWAVWIGIVSPRRRFLALALTFLPGFIIFAGVLLLRWTQTGSMTVMDPGPVFYEGNGPAAGGSSAAAPELVKWVEVETHAGGDSVHVAYRRVAGANLARPVTARESNLFWGRLALEAIVSRPLRSLRLESVKLVRTLGPFEFPDLICAYELDRRLSVVLPWGFGLLLVGIAWPFLCSRSRAGELGGPLAVVSLAIVIQMVFSASARQRLPLALGLMIAIPAAAADLLDRGSAVRRRTLIGTALGVGLSVLMSWLVAPSAVLGDLEFVRVLGSRAKPVQTGVARLLDGRAWRPDVAEAALQLRKGTELYLAGRFEEASKELETVASGSVTRVRTLVARSRYWLARCRLAARRRDEARQLAHSAFELMPEDLRIAALDAVLGHSGDLEDLAKSWRPAGIDSLSARVALAREVSFSGRKDLAIKIASPIAAALPEIRGKSSP